MVLLHIIANECGFLLIQTITVLMFFTTSVSLHFLPFATEKLEKDDQRKRMHTGRDSTGIKHKGKIKYIPFCFPVLSTTRRKTEDDPGCFHSFRYWIWFGGGSGRATVLGLKKYTGKFSQWRLCWCRGRATYTAAGMRCFWARSHPPWSSPPLLGLEAAGCARQCGSSLLLHAEQGSVKRSWQHCWANLGEPSSPLSRAQGSE